MTYLIIFNVIFFIAYLLSSIDILNIKDEIKELRHFRNKIKKDIERINHRMDVISISNIEWVSLHWCHIFYKWVSFDIWDKSYVDMLEKISEIDLIEERIKNENKETKD